MLVKSRMCKEILNSQLIVIIVFCFSSVVKKDFKRLVLPQRSQRSQRRDLKD